MTTSNLTKRLTKGFEEEVYTGTWAGEIIGVSHHVAADLSGYSTEPDSRNVEFTTEPYRDYEALLTRLMNKRCRLRRYLRELGDYTLIPGSTLSLVGAGEFQISDPDNPYYAYIRDTYGTDVVTASCHLNVGVEDSEVLLRAYRVLRCEASMFLALTAESPFLNGEVTGFHSTRWHVFPKTPSSVPLFADHEQFMRWFEGQLETKAMRNPRHLWLSVRPNGPETPRDLNRVEVRICDRIACPRLMQGVIALIEGRVWEVMENPDLDSLADADSADLEALALANEEAAAKDSLDAVVHDWRSGRELRMGTWIEERLKELEPTCELHGLAELLPAVEELLDQGSPAAKWLEQVRRGRSPHHVICEAAEEMAEIDKALMGAECA
ncbi:MAG: glutamate--cysteine ligase [Acidobacteriota bacterium]|nr:glutamate--cysteine ligase [Acidobacteriota bacterium]